jgi:hypothetical protein
VKIVASRFNGYQLLEFNDDNGEGCPLQDSSAITCDDYGSKLWLGINDPDPKRRNPSGPGWVTEKLPEDIYFTTRMHLSQKNVRKLLPYLIHFIEYGTINTQEKHIDSYPFCGASKPEPVEIKQGCFYILCVSCGAKSPAKNTQEEAVRLWNKRV